MRRLAAFVVLGCSSPPIVERPAPVEIVEVQGARDLPLAPLDEAGDRQPGLAFGVFLGGDIVALTVDAPPAQRVSDVYRVEGNRLVFVERAPEAIIGAADLDGDGALDRIGDGGALIGPRREPFPSTVMPAHAAAWIDGAAHVLSARTSCTPGAPLAIYRRDARARTWSDASALLPVHPVGVNVQAVHVEPDLVGAIGWSCTGGDPGDRGSVPIWYARTVDGWRETSIGRDVSGDSPMSALRVPGGALWISTHPDLVAFDGGHEVELPMRRVYSARGGAWIPWAMRAWAGGVLVAYGADDAFSSEVRHEIGWGQESAALYGRDGAAWVRWRHPAVDVLGEWRMIAARGAYVVVGGFGRQPRVLMVRDAR